MQSWRSNYRPNTFICRLSIEEIEIIIESLNLVSETLFIDRGFKEQNEKLDSQILKELIDQFLFLKKV